MGCLQCLTQVAIIYTHTHKLYMSRHNIMHVSTRTCYIHQKRGVTEVWCTAHFWVSYGRCTTSRSPMGRSEGLSRRWGSWVLPKYSECKTNIISMHVPFLTPVQVQEHLEATC